MRKAQVREETREGQSDSIGTKSRFVSRLIVDGTLTLCYVNKPVHTGQIPEDSTHARD